MDIRYRNDANHNYMIIKKEKGNVNPNHEKMAARNNIDGLLRMNLHFIDDDAFYYYEIRSKQSLARLFEGRYMTGEEISDLFRGMVRVFNEMEQYLLPVEGILFDPEYIYTDIDSITPEFVFYPSSRAAGKEEDILALATFLIDHADKNDPLAGKLAYSYFESVTDGVISPASLIGSVPVKEKETEEEEPEKGYDYWETEEDMSELDYFLKDDPGEEKNTGILKIAALCLGLIVTAAVFYLILVLNPSLIPSLQMNEKEYITAGCIIALLFGAAVTAVIFIYNRQLAEKKEENSKRRQESLEKMAKDPHAEDERKEYENETDDPEEDEKTTLLSVAGNAEFLPYLTGNDQGRETFFEIDKNPFIIGKKGNRADGILQNSSVSRMHASIRNEGGRFFLSDMNSTNGTFINGRRLEPNETTALEDGDSVAFAGTVMVFRVRNQRSCQAC